MKQRIFAAITVVVLLALAAAQTYHFLRWNFDDAYIVYKIARNLVQGAGWSFNAGEIHNASTSVLSTIFIALAGTIVPDVRLAAHLLAAAWLAITGIAFAWLFSRKFSSWVGMAAGAGLIGLLAENSTWGLETHLFFCLLAIFLVMEERRRNPWYVVGLLTLARPDALLIAALRWLRSFAADRSLSIKGLLQCLLVISPWVIFSVIHFHQVFPDTLSNKIWQGRSGYWGVWPVYVRGLVQHVVEAPPFLMAAYVLSAPGLYSAFRDRSVLLYLAAFAGLQQTAYVLLDVPAYHWYFAVFDGTVVLLAFYAIGTMYSALVERLPVFLRRRDLPGTALFALALIVIITQVRAAVGSPQAMDARDEAYRRVVAALKANGIPAGPVAAVEVGTFGFYLDDHPVLDLIGLTTPNPEFVSGRNNDRFFAAPPPTVLFHSPLWPFELALSNDLRFTLMYGPATIVPDPAMAMQYFLLKADARAPSAEEISAYVQRHYPPFLPVVPSDLDQMRSSADVSCILDQVNGRLAGASVFQLPRTTLSFEGWAVDRRHADGPAEAYGVLTSSSQRYSMKASRVKRADVAAHLNNPSLDMAGFRLEGSIVGLPAGEYRLGVAQQRDGGFLYCEFPNAITLE